jgi:hypothetical protein
MKTAWNALKRSGRFFHAMALFVYRAGPGISHWATIIAAVVAITTFYLGYQQFHQTQEATRQTLELQKQGIDLERESKAVELLLRYNEMMSAPPPAQKSGAANPYWQVNIALSLAESIFILRKDDENWRATIAWMLSNHVEDLKKERLNCSTFDSQFIQFVNQVMKQNTCRDETAQK